ncbi:hypothetical protein PHET_02411 [Paragonimus heterotremus]|uniref:Histone H2A n=1 Tax=Paragonimus heterotremus TaxID=100268 RepID=A0A8J4SPP5_9TREM|nr:hypothetical protein PHET_02411 [Paragonimus heterotremus]
MEGLGTDMDNLWLFSVQPTPSFEQTFRQNSHWNITKDGGKGGKTRVKSKTRSARAGLQFPVGRVHRLLRKDNCAERVGAGAPLYLATVLEYLAAEV